METIGKRIKGLRTYHKLSMEKLANKIGVSSGNVSDWENERSKPSSDAIINISNFFNVSADWLLTGKSFDSSNVIENKSNVKQPVFEPLVEEALKDDPELYSFWETMMDREDLKLLFKKTKPLKPKTVKQIIAWIKAIEDEESQEE